MSSVPTCEPNHNQPPRGMPTRFVSMIKSFSLQVLIVILVYFIISSISAIAVFKNTITNLKQAEKYEEAIQQFVDEPLMEFLFINDKIRLLSQVGKWAQLKKVVDQALQNTIQNSYFLWYYKGLAELYLGNMEQCEIAFIESVLMKETVEAKAALRGISKSRVPRDQTQLLEL